MTKNRHSYFYYSQLLVIASFPFPRVFSSIAIILSLLLLIRESIVDTSFRNSLFVAFKQNKIAQLLVVFFVAYLISAFIHFANYQNKSIPITSIEHRLSFLLFPFIMAPLAYYNKNQIKWLFLAFVISLIFSSLITIITGTFATITTGSLYYYDPDKSVTFNNFMYHRLGSYVGMHAVYYAEYVLLGFIIWVSYSYHSLSSWSKRYRLLSILTGILLATMIFLLKSAAILIIFLVLIAISTSYYLHKEKEKITRLTKVFIASAGIVLIVTLSIRAINKIGTKASFFTYDITQPGGGDWNAVNLRLAKWHVAKMAIADHWLLGVGPGNLNSTLDYYYKKTGFEYALQLHYNPHNQFLHTFLTLGILGGAVLVLLYVFSVIQSLRKKDAVMLLFLISFFLFSLSESTLAVNKGIVFFTAFLSFFSYLPNKSNYYLNESADQR